MGKHEPTGNILHLAQEKVNSAKNRVSVNIKPFSSVINLNITIIVSVFRFNLLDYSLNLTSYGMWEDLFCDVWNFI